MSLNPGDARLQPGPASQARSMSAGALAGEYPTQNDTVIDSDNCDATHPLNLDFIVPSNCQRVVSARLSFKLRAYRTYSSFTTSTTGAGTAHSHSHTHGAHSHSHGHSHTHGAHSHSHAHGFSVNTNAETGHSHSHSHGSSFGIAPTVGGASLTFAAGAIMDTVGSGGTQSVSVGTDATGSSGHSHGLPNTGTDATATTPTADATVDATGTTPTADATVESTHTHPFVGSSTLGVVEGAVATGVTVALDGVDITATLGGGAGFTADALELDLGASLGGSPKTGWHLIALQPSGFGRIKGILRLIYVANPGVR